jgi:predicted ester cyclase
MRLLAVGIAVIVGASCSSGGKSSPKEASTTSLDPTRLRESALRYTEAWCSQDPARVAAFFAPDGSLKVNDAPPAVGRAAITAVAQGFMTAFPDMQVLMDDLVVRGDEAVYKWTLVGTNSGPGGTGRKVRISGYEEWRMGPDGLIADSKGHFDREDYKRQLETGEKVP